MEFHIPDTSSQEEADETYERIVRWIERLRGPVQDRRIYEIEYYDGDNDRTDCIQIGDVVPQVGERAIAILQSKQRDMFMICTPTRGVIKGGPIMIGDRNVRSAIEFEDRPD